MRDGVRRLRGHLSQGDLRAAPEPPPGATMSPRLKQAGICSGAAGQRPERTLRSRWPEAGSAQSNEKRGPVPTNAANSMRSEWSVLRPALK